MGSGAVGRAELLAEEAGRDAAPRVLGGCWALRSGTTDRAVATTAVLRASVVRRTPRLLAMGNPLSAIRFEQSHQRDPGCFRGQPDMLPGQFPARASILSDTSPP